MAMKLMVMLWSKLKEKLQMVTKRDRRVNLRRKNVLDLVNDPDLAQGNAPKDLAHGNEVGAEKGEDGVGQDQRIVGGQDQESTRRNPRGSVGAETGTRRKRLLETMIKKKLATSSPEEKRRNWSPPTWKSPILRRGFSLILHRDSSINTCNIMILFQWTREPYHR